MYTCCGQSPRKSDCKTPTFIHLKRQTPPYVTGKDTCLLRCTKRCTPHTFILSQPQSLSELRGWGKDPCSEEQAGHCRKGLQKVSGGSHRQLWPFPWPEKAMGKDNSCHWPLFLLDRMGLGSCVSIKLPGDSLILPPLQ